MSSLWTRSTDALAKSLDPKERDAVLGDFAELGITGRQALRSMLGLVVRQQLRAGRRRESWLAFVTAALVCPLLAMRSADLTQLIFPNLWMWLRNGVPYDTGLSSAAVLAGFCFRALALITWSWTSAFALGALSRTTIRMNGIFFFVLCLALGIDENVFYRRFLLTPWLLLPISITLLGVLLPAYYGLRQGARFPNMKIHWMVPLAAWTAMIGSLAFWTQGWSGAALGNWSRGQPPLALWQLAEHAAMADSALTHLFTAGVLTVPMLYMLAFSMFLHRRSGTGRG